MNIKVCGITQMKQLHQLDSLNIDFAGLNFYKNSPRFVANNISSKELNSADLDLKIAGVFVNHSYEEIMQIIDEYRLEIVQLHGDESPELCERLSNDVEVIKVLRIGGDNTQTLKELIEDFDEVCDYYLFDTAVPSSSNEGDKLIETYGGSGLKFDWEILRNAKIEKPFFLSGGIGEEDAEIIKAFKHPDFYGVDINSKFETEPGVKDLTKVLKFKMGLK